MVVRGLLRRCPQCGCGRLFRRWFSLVDECPRCHHRFDRREEGYWTGAMAVNIVVTEALFFVLFVGLLVALWPDPPWLGIGITVGVFNGLFPLVFYPFSKTLWVALSLWWGPLEADEVERIEPNWRAFPPRRR
jgi:uncharacterized protein (DUF983 family)